MDNPQDKFREQCRLDRLEPPYLRDDVKKAIKFAIRKLYDESYYAPLIERFPVLVDEQVPKSARNDILEHETCACTDMNNVYVLSDELTEDLNEMSGMFNRGNSNIDLVDNIAALLAHEYTHILCQHKNVAMHLGKVTKAEATCFQLACEIEANRGDMVKGTKKDWYGEQYQTMVYKVGVTDDSIPETKKDRFLPQIYETLLKMYNDQKQKLEQLLQQIMNKDMEGSMDEKGKGNGKKNQNKVQGKSQTSTDTSKMDDGDTANSSVNRQQNGDEDENKYEAEWDELTQEQIEESIKKASETVQKVQSALPGDETGIGLESYDVEYKPELTPQDNLQLNHERWNEKRVKKELAKMKGLIRGNISKNREKTYARPTRRPITTNGGLIRKGVRYEKSYSPKVLIAMDSSGSMCSTTMKEVACAIENIFKDLGKPKQGSYICKHESNVSDVKPMRQWKEVVESYYPRGGNCFTHVVEKANELGVDVVLNIGDGQDCVYRGLNGEKEINQFKAAGRKWFDVLVTNKNENRYYEEEAYFDEEKGFHREGIYLGDKITKYLK